MMSNPKSGASPQGIKNKCIYDNKSDKLINFFNTIIKVIIKTNYLANPSNQNNPSNPRTQGVFQSNPKPVQPDVNNPTWTQGLGSNPRSAHVHPEDANRNQGNIKKIDRKYEKNKIELSNIIGL